MGTFSHVGNLIADLSSDSHGILRLNLRKSINLPSDWLNCHDFGLQGRFAQVGRLHETTGTLEVQLYGLLALLSVCATMRHMEKTITAVAHDSTPSLQALTAVNNQPTSWTQSDFFFGCVLSYFPFLWRVSVLSHFIAFWDEVSMRRYTGARTAFDPCDGS